MFKDQQQYLAHDQHLIVLPWVNTSSTTSSSVAVLLLTFTNKKGDFKTDCFFFLLINEGVKN